MKLEIELDLNKIDYDAINQQIQEKIAAADLNKLYNIEYRIQDKIKEEVARTIYSHLNQGAWCNLNDATRREVKEEISKTIHDCIDSRITEILGQVSDEEFDKMIYDLIPVVIVNQITRQLHDMMANSYYGLEASVMSQCQSMIENVFRR